ncbi:hypothetical protein NUW58_g7463 [Xylaria curta]|uniref:Uncharacterized protein n=1 Tax=Xylaria curta TaxID=42375 RepID=A0ACC1NI35_9PEZI|nr:hypothetical protein NUW58_g7463 [Xylaria curta]
MSSTMTMTQTMTPLGRTRSRSNSGAKGRRTRVHFEIEDATPEFYGSKLIDFLSLYSGSSSFEVAIAALCSLGLFVAVGQGILEGPQLGIVAVLVPRLYFPLGIDWIVGSTWRAQLDHDSPTVEINGTAGGIATGKTLSTEEEIPITIETTADDYLNGSCKGIILSYTRGTTQSGNTVRRCEAVRPFSAVCPANAEPTRSPPSKASNTAQHYSPVSCQAAAKPGTPRRGATRRRGCSYPVQLGRGARARRGGAARVAGDTQKHPHGSIIPNFDVAKTLILCNDSDRVCEGTLIITGAHPSSTSSVPVGVSFIVDKSDAESAFVASVLSLGARDMWV